jgi:hypothetical protein
MCVLESLSSTIVDIQIEQNVWIWNLFKIATNSFSLLNFCDTCDHQKFLDFNWLFLALPFFVAGYLTTSSTTGVAILSQRSSCVPQFSAAACDLSSLSVHFSLYPLLCTQNFSSCVQYPVLYSLTLNRYYLKLSAIILCTFYILHLSKIKSTHTFLCWNACKNNEHVAGIDKKL